MHHRLISLVLAALTVLALSSAPPARAQLMPAYGQNGAPMSSFLSTSFLAGQALLSGAAQGSRAGAPRGRAVSTITTGTSGAARKLAAAYPAPKRPEVERMFAGLLAGYARLERQVAVPAGDLAGALALLVIASYEAYRDTSLDPSIYPPVVDQLRGAIGSHPAFAKTAMAERRELYEQLAMIGMFVLVVRAELAKQPNPAVVQHLRVASKGYLGQLGLDADRLAITRSGLGQPPGGAAPRVDAMRAPPPAEPPPAPSPGADRSPAVQASRDIVTVGFYTRTEVGHGGWVNMVPTPIVLFRSGDALLVMRHLNDPGGLEASKRRHPGDWTRWRRGAGGRIERRDGAGWRKLEWTKQHDRLPKGFTLHRSYHQVSAGATQGAGGMAMASWRNLRLDRSGRFTTGGGSGGGGRGVAVRSRAQASGGTYEVAGYTLTLRHDDGRVVHRSIIADPKDPKVIWIDGEGYTSD